mgnify:CR=1 FL=1
MIASIEGGEEAADDLREQARSLSPDEPLLDQKETVQSLFRDSAEAIRTLSNRA